MKKTLSIVLGLILMLSVAFTSLGSSATVVKADSNKPVTITVGDWPRENDTEQRATYDNFVKTLTQKYPYITVKPDEYAYDPNTYFPKAASGQLANVYGTFFSEPNKIVAAGYAADVTTYAKQYGLTAAIDPSFMKMGQVKGKQYGIPADGYAMGMWYNVKLMKQAGLVDKNGVPKFPQTYAELATMAKQIKDKTGKSGFTLCTKSNQGGWEWMNIAWSYGVVFETRGADGKYKATFNTPQAVAALQYVKDLKWKYNVLPANALIDITEMTKLLATDQTAMAYGMHYWKNDPTNNYKMSKDDLAMSALPAGPAARKACAGGQMIMFSNNSTPDQLDACFKWLDVRGINGKVDAASMKGFEDNQANDAKANRPVGPHGVRVWISPERIAAEDAIYKKYTNVNMNLWNDFVNNAGKYIQGEEPVDAQGLYKLLDPIIQTVITKKDANPKTLLDKAVKDWQKVLDK
jgi:multiple sugar transport system substrate-binding protein